MTAYIRTFLFAISLIFSVISYAQQENKPRQFGIHAGINNGVLDSGFGPSFSFHYVAPSQKALRFESMFFFDSQLGTTFLSGYDYTAKGIGVAAGGRLRRVSGKSFNPSLVLMPGFMYSSDKSGRSDDPGRSGVSAALSAGISAAFPEKHMITLGFNTGENFTGLHLKYGFWF